MDAVIDSANGRSMLYNSLLHHSGTSSLIHTNLSMPCMLLGTAGGNINTGYLVDCGNKFGGSRRVIMGENGYSISNTGFSNSESAVNFHGMYEGIIYNRLYKTIFDAFDIPQSHYSPHVVRVDGLTEASAPGGYGILGTHAAPHVNTTLSNTPIPLPATSLAT